MPVESAERMRDRSFQRIREVVYRASGIALGPRKEALVSARVGKRMRALGISSVDSYVAYLEEHYTDEIVALLDAVSTNVTSFFREPHHFEFVAEAAAALYERGQRRFRYWCAACSTGEEPLSLAIVLKEALPYPDVDLRVLATDISTEALRHCMSAAYDERRMKPVPAAIRDRWFRGETTEDGTVWRPKEPIRSAVVFRRLNLSTPPFPMKGPFDAVFCRNVMIYFDDPVRRALLDEAHRLLAPGGHLIVGHAESLAGMIGEFKHVRPAVYRKA